MSDHGRSQRTRAILLRRQRAALRDVLGSVKVYQNRVARAIRRGGTTPDLTRLVDQLTAIRESLGLSLTRALRHHRRLTMADIITIWDTHLEPAARRLARQFLQAEVLRRSLALPDRVVSIQTIVTGATDEVAALLAEGIRQGADPRSLARGVAQYLQGADDIPLRDGRLDLRVVPHDQRGAARTLQYQAERLTLSELAMARHETELLLFAGDRSVEAVQWVVADNRGSATIPDICDVLATVDSYGIGKGAYPINRVPPLPHPFCRCSIVPLRETKKATKTPAVELVERVEGFRNHPPGFQNRIRDQYRVAMDAGVTAGELIVGFRDSLP